MSKEKRHLLSTSTSSSSTGLTRGSRVIETASGSEEISASLRPNQKKRLEEDSPLSQEQISILPAGISPTNPYARTFIANTQQIHSTIQSTSSPSVFPQGERTDDTTLQTQALRREAPIPREESPMAQLLKYHIKEGQNPKFTLKDKAHTAASLLLGGLSLAIYWSPTYEFVEGKLGPAIFYETTVSGSTFGVATYATYQSIDRFREHLPAHIVEAIEVEYKRNKCVTLIQPLRPVGMGMIALVGGLPLAFAPNSPILRYLIMTVMTIINYYVAELITDGIIDLKKLFAPSKKQSDYNKLINSFDHAINSAVRSIFEEGGIPQELTPGSVKTGEEMLKILAIRSSQKSTKYKDFTFSQNLMKKFAPSLIGAILTDLGSTGYVLRLYDSIAGPDAEPNASNISATVLCSIFFYIITAMFGARAFETFYNVLTCNGTLPFSYHLFQSRTVLLMLLLAFAASFSYPTSVYLIQSSPHFQGDGYFSNDVGLFTFLAGLTSIVTALTANSIIANMAIEGGARHWSDPNRKALANFVIEMRHFLWNVRNRMDPRKFAQSLLELSREVQDDLLLMANITDNPEQMLRNVAGLEPTQEVTANFLTSMSRTTRNIIREGYVHVIGNDEALERFESLNTQEKKAALESRSPNPTPQPPSITQRFWNALPNMPSWLGGSSRTPQNVFEELNEEAGRGLLIQ